MEGLPSPWDWTHGRAPYCHCPPHGPHHGHGFHHGPHHGHHHGPHGPHGPNPPPWCHCYEDLVKKEIQRRKDDSKKLENEGNQMLQSAKTKDDLIKAKEKFERAWKLYNGESSLLSKIKECDCWIYIRSGDEYFNLNNFLSASNEYNKALTISKNGNLTPLINKSNELLNKTQNEIIRIENEKIEKLKKQEIEKKKKEAEEILKKQKEEEEKLKKIEQEKKEKLRQQQIEFEKKRKEEEKRVLKEREDKIEREKVEKEKKIQKAISKFESISKDLIFNEKEKLKFKLLYNQNYINEIEKYIDNNKQILIPNDLLKKEKNQIFKTLEIILNKILLEKDSNILLIGETGVGKSTLINSILELPPEQAAKTGSLEPCTMGEPKFYSSKSIGDIKLIDTRGFEKDKGYLISKMEKDIINFINSQKLTKQPVHLVWYCFKGARFEQSEEIIIRKIKELNLSVLLVYTQAVTDELMDFEKLSSKGYDYELILSKDMNKYAKSYGLDKLKLKTNEYINNNYKSVLKDIVINQNINFLKNEIKNLMNNSNNINKDNFISKIKDILKIIFKLNNIDYNLINNIIFIIKGINSIIENYTVSFMDNNIEQLAYSLLNLQQNINIEFNGLLINLRNKEQWKEIIISTFKKEFISSCFDYSVNNVFPKISQIFLDYLEQDYKNFLEKNYFINRTHQMGIFNKI